MPELPEVETIKRQLKRSINKLKIRAVFVYMDKMVVLGSGKVSNIKTGSKSRSQKFMQTLKGKTILDVSRRGKFLIFRLSNGYYLMVHLRMSGQLIHRGKKKLETPLYLSLSKSKQKKTLPDKHSHVEIVFGDGSKLFWNDPRQFGHMRLATEEEMNKVMTEQALGPEPLDLGLAAFTEIVKINPKKRAKEFLLNQRIIAGIGNIYADESLFVSKIHPLRKMGSLSKNEMTHLRGALQEILKKAIAMKGSSLRNYLNVNGLSGKFSQSHLVYGRGKQPCFECGNTLQFTRLGGRGTVFCQNCQPAV